MRPAPVLALVLAAAGLAVIAPLGDAVAKPASRQSTRPLPPRLDLADTAAGIYHGDVISDARGSSRSDVTITIVKTGPNTVRVTSDYARLPSFTIRLQRVMQTIQQVGTAQTFLLDLSRAPRRLDINVDDASWAGEKTG